MSESAIALVFSPEEWVERLHRHLTDHGGARVRQIVLDPTLALDEAYDVLVVSHRWPGLTRSFVASVRDRGRAVLGVFDPEEPAGRAHLVGLGVDGVVQADAASARFVDVIDAVAATRVPPAHGEHGRERVEDVGWPAAPRTTVVVTGLAGSGTTEVALAVAGARATAGPTVLVDADERAPSLAARLGLPIEPCLRDAVDAVEYGNGELARTLVTVARDLQVLPGLPPATVAAGATPGEVLHVVDVLGELGASVVVDAGCLTVEAPPALLAGAGTVLLIAPATPVAVARLLTWFGAVRPHLGTTPVHVVFNRAGRARYRRSELEHELCRTYTPTGVWFAPDDRRVDDAAWDGALVRRGPFADAIGRVAHAVGLDVDVPRRRRRARRHRSAA